MSQRLVSPRSKWISPGLLLFALLAAPGFAGPSALTITSASPLPAGSIGIPYSFQFTAANGLGTLSWYQSGTIPNLTLSSSGVLSGTPQTGGVFQISVSVMDSQERTDTKTFQIAITAPIVLPPATLPNGTVGVPYTFTLVATGGAGSFTYVLSGGSLPAGLTLQSNGTILGTPIAAGTSQFFVRVRDSLNAVLIAGPFNLTINPVNPPPPPPPPPNNPLIVRAVCPALPFPAGGPVDLGLAITGGDGSYSIRVTSPSWLSYQPSTGRITGTPPASGPFILTAVVSDSTGAQTTVNCGFTVGKPLAITGSCPGAVNVGVAFDFTLTTEDGQGPYNWVVNSPSWVQVKQNGQSIASFTGTAPAGGPADISISVTDSIRSQPVTFVCHLSVGFAALTAKSPGCPAQALLPGQTVSLDLSVSGGAGGYKWSITPANSWLTLSATSGSTVTLRGTAPAEGGSYPVSVQVTDSAGATVNVITCTIQTLSPLQINGKTPEYTAGQPFTTTLTITGGLPPYAVSLSGAPFAGVSLNGNTITFSGTPPNTDPFTCTITATDRGGLPPATFNCSGRALFAPLNVTSLGGQNSACPATPIVFGQPFSGQLQAAGGDGRYTFTFTGPDWLKTSQPSASTFAVTGTPDRIQDYSYVVQVRDASGTTPAEFGCTLRVNPPNIPTLSLAVNIPTDILQPAPVLLTLNQPAPTTLTGHVLLSFTSSSPGPADNLQVQFLDPAAVNRTLAFTIPAGASSVTLGRIQPGTVAGVITVTVTDLSTGGRDVLVGRPAAQSTVPKLAPVLLDLTFENETTNGFTLVITGFSTPRDASNLSVTFSARSGAKLTGNTTFTVPVSDAFTPFFGAGGSALPGSTFFLRVPVTINGNKNDIGAVSVQLTNSAGQSNTLNKTR